MGGTFAVLGVELANRLLSKGFELVEIKQGKYTIVFYFVDTEELYLEIEKYLAEQQVLTSRRSYCKIISTT